MSPIRQTAEAKLQEPQRWPYLPCAHAQSTIEVARGIKGVHYRVGLIWLTVNDFVGWEQTLRLAIPPCASRRNFVSNIEQQDRIARLSSRRT